jgi:hypothetical protein
MKRTAPLARNTPLVAYTPLSRSSGLTRSPWSSLVPFPVSGGTGKSAATRETGFSRAVKLGVRRRAGRGSVEDAMCEACGKWLGRYDGEVQHRAARGAGGCTDEVIAGYANAALLCGHGAAHIRSGCHGACEDRRADMSMDDKGFWIRHGTTPEYDPRLIPVKLASEHGSGILVFLAADGLGPDGTGYLLESPGRCAA